MVFNNRSFRGKTLHSDRAFSAAEAAEAAELLGFSNAAASSGSPFNEVGFSTCSLHEPNTQENTHRLSVSVAMNAIHTQCAVKK